jgi:hypothetical protein
MRDRRTLYLVLIFAFALALRLFFAFKAPHFTDDQAYFTLRQVESILETGVPLYTDDLSYGGRVSIFLPLYYYVLAFFGLFMPMTLVLKLIPNIMASTIVLLTYSITLHTTRKWKVALFTAAIATVVPVYTSQTVNNASPYSLAAPLMFLALYLYMRTAQDKRYALPYLLAFFVLATTHASASVFLLGLLIHLLLAKLGGLKTNRSEVELALFSTLFLLWSYFTIFKNIFLSYGASFLWQNIPAGVLSSYFRDITLIDAINQIGLIPLSAGIYLLYRYLFRVRNRSIYLLTSFTISVSLLLWLRLISFFGGLILLGLILTLFFGQFFSLFLDYIRKTKFSKLVPYAVGLAVLLLLATSGASTLFYTDREIRRGFGDDEINALVWLRENTNESATVLGTLEEGHLITAVAQRSNVMDSNFLLAPDVDQRLQDLSTMYTTSSQIEAVKLFTQYDVGYIFFSINGKLRYKRTSLSYAEDANCYQLVYDREVQIYQAKCHLETA